MARDPADRMAIDPAAAHVRRFATLVVDGVALESLIARSRESQEPLALRGLQFARAALARVQGRRQEAAKLIGWGRNTLTRKLREFGLE